MDQEVMTVAITPYSSANSGLIKRDGKYITTKGYKTDALLEFMTKQENVTRWVDVDELVRLFDGRLSDRGRWAMRKRLTKAFHDFRERQYLMLRAYNNPGSIVRVKLFDSSDGDKMFAKEQLTEMQAHQLDSREVLDSAAHLAGIELQWDIPFEEAAEAP